MPRSGSQRFTRHFAPSISRAASASARRSSTVPLLPISPAVRSHRPDTKPELHVLCDQTADADFDVVGVRAEGQQVHRVDVASISASTRTRHRPSAAAPAAHA